MWSILHVRYGEPILVKKYQKEYKENPQKAHISLRDDIDQSLRPLMIDIRNINLYDTYESIRTLYVKNLILKFQLGKLNQYNKFEANKITIKALETYEKDNPEKVIELKQKVDEYKELKNKYHVADKSIEKPYLNILMVLINSLLLILCLPVFIYGLINNLITYFVPQIILTKIKDKQFHSSIKFAWAVFVIPIIYLIQITTFAIIISKFWWILLYALSLPISGLLASLISKWAGTITGDLKLIRLKKFNNNAYKKLKELHKNIILELDLIVTHWNRKKEISHPK
jgi:hypothetical protein